MVGGGDPRRPRRTRRRSPPKKAKGRRKLKGVRSHREMLLFLTLSSDTGEIGQAPRAWGEGGGWTTRGDRLDGLENNRELGEGGGGDIRCCPNFGLFFMGH